MEHDGQNCTKSINDKTKWHLYIQLRNGKPLWRCDQKNDPKNIRDPINGNNFLEEGISPLTPALAKSHPELWRDTAYESDEAVVDD